jgi:sugar lactone lactonase YvrE
MTYLSRTSVTTSLGTLLQVSLLVLGVLDLGCGGSNSSVGDGGGDAVTPPDTGACPAGGPEGTLSVKITGTPGNVGAVTAALLSVTSSMDLPLVPGPYTVSAARVATPAPLVRLAFEPSVDLPAPCVHSGQTTTVNVSYTLIATSNHLWAGNNQPGKEILGFSPSSLAASGSHTADLTAGTVGSLGFTFDPAGNLWVVDATAGDAPLARYPVSAFATSGAKTPDITIQSTSFGAGIPGAQALAFDAAGNLWVSVLAARKVVRFTPAQLAATGAPVAAVEIGDVGAPSGIAFDQTGNLFIAVQENDTIARFDKSRLGASTTGPDLSIVANSIGPVVAPLTSPLGIAFDTAGNLWANFNGTITRLTPADLQGTGTNGVKSVAPGIEITTDVLSLPEGIAFDEQGGLWLAYSAGKLARLSPTQLAASGTVTPSIVITSADIAYVAWFAIYPAPAGTPLAHRLP